MTINTQVQEALLEEHRGDIRREMGQERLAKAVCGRAPVGRLVVTRMGMALIGVGEWLERCGRGAVVNTPVVVEKTGNLRF